MSHYDKLSEESKARYKEPTDDELLGLFADHESLTVGDLASLSSAHIFFIADRLGELRESGRVEMISVGRFSIVELEDDIP